MKAFKFLIFLSLLTIQSCQTQTKKINGVSFVASREPISDLHINPVVNINANYAAVMPFGFIRSLTHPEVVFNSERQRFGERRVGVKQYIEELEKKAIKIMLKPQIWIGRGQFTGYVEMKSKAEWKVFEDSFGNRNKSFF